MYKTSDLAKIIGVHPNTVRLYENIGFISKPLRLKNGYRVFSDIHIAQMKVARLALRGEILQNGLRKKAIEIIRLLAAGNTEEAYFEVIRYDSMLEKEIQNAREAVKLTEKFLDSKSLGEDEVGDFKRKEVSEILEITIDTLRNWELNGLIDVKRSKNGYRVYTKSDIEKLKIIRSLRCANYSLSSILRLLNKLKRCEEKNTSIIEEFLNTPDKDEDIVSVCDRLMFSLKETRADVKEMINIINEIRNIPKR